MPELTKQRVFVTFRHVGFHCWLDAPVQYSYLRHLHRHEFHVRVDLNVNHANRAVEFCEFKGIARREFIGMGRGDSGMYDSRSCEMLASELGNTLIAYGYAVAKVEVSEDGENGGITEWL